jgi:ribosome biogenesis GTPase
MDFVNAENEKGIITKAVGGLYFVETPGGIFECKARGIFRKDELSPCAGDNVLINPENKVITKILERKNSIIRPPIANLDQLVFVISTCEPEPNFTVVDKFVAVAEFKKIEPVVVITKVDLERGDEIKKIYESVGIKVLVIDYSIPDCCAELYSLLEGKISAFTGNSGVGKSTLLNHIDPSFKIETNEISKKLGRGKHTTRQVELYKLKNGGYVADTPGFSSFDINKYDIILKEQLAGCFREFAPFAEKCRFLDCSHTKEKGCAVIEAVENGIIAKSRYKSYVLMYEEAKQIKEWEVKSKKQ